MMVCFLVLNYMSHQCDRCFFVSIVPPSVIVYEKNGVTLKLQTDKQTDTGMTITLTATNSTDRDITSLTLQAAVPKVCFPISFVSEYLCICYSKLLRHK